MSTISGEDHSGISRDSHSQSEIKSLIGRELEGYRIARKIEKHLEPRHRCWRLSYKDELPFHMDAVPAIPAGNGRSAQLRLLIEQRGADPRLAADIAADAVWITDDRTPNFDRVDRPWPSSNPEGYARWFVSRMEGAERALKAQAQVDDVPLYRRKSSLQRVIQLLKRHRDVMFVQAPDSKPISIIITTLAADAYLPGQRIDEAMSTVIAALNAFLQSNSSEVLNPVDPQENFADKWTRADCAHLLLKENFHAWIQQAAAFFSRFHDETDSRLLTEAAQKGLHAGLSEAAVAAILGTASASPSASAGAPRIVIQSPPKPWG